MYYIYIFFFFSQNLFTIVLSILPAPYACVCRLLKTIGRRSFHPALIPTPEPGTGRLMHVRVRRDLDDLKNTSLCLCVCVCVSVYIIIRTTMMIIYKKSILGKEWAMCLDMGLDVGKRSREEGNPDFYLKQKTPLYDGDEKKPHIVCIHT